LIRIRSGQLHTAIIARVENAAIPGTDQFLITGKMLPTTFRVAFVPAR